MGIIDIPSRTRRGPHYETRKLANPGPVKEHAAKPYGNHKVLAVARHFILA